MDLPPRLPDAQGNSHNGDTSHPAANPPGGDTESSTTHPAASIVPADILDKLPPEERERLQMTVDVMSFASGTVNPIAHKVTSQHITDMIASQTKSEERRYDDKKDSRFKGVIVYIATLIFALILIAILSFSGQTAVLTDLITKGLPYLVVAGTSFGGGYGFKAWRDGADDD